MKTDKLKKMLIKSWILTALFGLAIGCLLTLGILVIDAMEVKSSYGRIGEDFSVKEVTFEWSQDDFIPLNTPLDEELQEYIYYMAEDNGIEFSFVMGMIRNESNFKPDIISDTDDYGLMQINQKNHEWLSETLGVENYLDPHENVQAGIFILGRLFEKYEDPSKVLMAYNMGERGAKRLWEQGIFESKYSIKIMEFASEYEKQISEKKGEQ